LQFRFLADEMDISRLAIVLGVSDPRPAAAIDLAQIAALRHVLAQFCGGGVRPLVMKGAALSHLIYPGQVRPRNDDDVLVAPGDFAAAADILMRCGYVPATQVTAPELTGQQLFHRQAFGVTHYLDLHVRPLNPLAFADLPSFDELWESSIAVPPLGGVRAIGLVHALLFACAHRVAHHTPTEDPVWLLDIDRLARRLSSEEWERFAAVALRARCARLSASELRRAVTEHATPVPEAAFVALDAAGREPSAAHLTPRGPLQVQWLNLRHARSWRLRLALVRAHLLPPPAYMRARFGLRPNQRLGWAYTKRLVGGATRWSREGMRRTLRAR
jgi:hypothetical protein